MRVRKTTEDGDMRFGRNQADYWRDVPDGVAQVVQSRLQLYLGEWFLDTSDGMPWKTQVLGKYTGPTRDMVIRTRILQTQGVTAIDAYDSQLNRDTRGFAAQATIDTLYGPGLVPILNLGVP